MRGLIRTAFPLRHHIRLHGSQLFKISHIIPRRSILVWLLRCTAILLSMIYVLVQTRKKKSFFPFKLPLCLPLYLSFFFIPYFYYHRCLVFHIDKCDAGKEFETDSKTLYTILLLYIFSAPIVLRWSKLLVEESLWIVLYNSAPVHK